MNIAVLGAGAWGTALAIALGREHGLSLWARDPAQAAWLAASRENERYLPGFTLPARVQVTADFSAAVRGAELALVAVPLLGLRQTLAALWLAAPSLPFLWLCKGLEARSGLLPHQVAAAEMPADVCCGALTGPSFAQEVARGLPTALTLASADAAFARRIAAQLSNQRLRIYSNDDVIGAEVGGAVKNVLAIATGIGDGLGLGSNARAALITRGLAEISRFALALGARRETLMGLTGVGDMILTCTGDLSRNRRVGLALASGRPLAAITAELGHVAEGVWCAHAVARRAAELGVDMPITRAVCAVLSGEVAATTAVEQLMARDLRNE